MMPSQTGDLLAGLRFRLAEGQDRFKALTLRRAVYAADWPGVPESAVIDELDARALHLIAEDQRGNIIAASRMIPPDQRPFDLEKFLRLSEFIEPNRLPAEIGRLCMRQDCRVATKGVFINIGLMRLTLAAARDRGITDLLLKAGPRLLRFYGSAGFVEFGRPFLHPVYGEEHPMRLDLLEFERKTDAELPGIARLLLAVQGRA